MLSGEGNAEERWKTTIGIISKKKQLCTCSSLILYISLPSFCTRQRETSRNLFNSCTFYGGIVVRVLVHFFFIAAHFHLALVAASFSYFASPPLQNFHVVLPTKKMSPSFILSRFRSLSPFFALSFAGLQPDFLFFSVFLLLYIPNLWTCWTMNLSWIL